MVAQSGGEREIEALEACVDALYSLTPEARRRGMNWLAARVYDDLKKEADAANAVGWFLYDAAAKMETVAV